MNSSATNFCDYSLVLASGSPRRKELLTAAGFEFKVMVPDDSIEKSVPSSLTPVDFVYEASFQKAKAIASSLNKELVIAADTIAEHDNRILGKPDDREHASQILRQLSGTIHRVLTGVTVWNCQIGRHATHVETTELEMLELSERTLQEYLDSNDWVGKAGAFGYQDRIPWVKILNGLESNVVGLPVEQLPELFSKIL